MRLVVIVVAVMAVVACSDPPGPPPPPPHPQAGSIASDAAVTAHEVAHSLGGADPTGAAALARDPRRWFAGDVHMHVAPPDSRDDVVMSAAEIAEVAAREGLDFVVLTPHLWRERWRAGRREFLRAWRDLAAQARSSTRPTLIPGVEWGDRDGHFTVAGVDLATLRDDDFLAAAAAAGAFISANHPFAVPTRIFGVRASHFDLSYRPWSRGRPGFSHIAGAEVWNVPLGLANLVSRPGGRTGEARAWTALDHVVHTERRPVTAVGGTDNHRRHVIATTWVLAVDAGATAILGALAAGATCVGGPEAGTFRARGDAGTWVRVGEAVVAQTITLAWTGAARLFIDDVDVGEHADGFVHATGGALHTYRIAIGPSRCGFIYANLAS